MKRGRLILFLMVFAQFACADNYHEATAGPGQAITPAYFGVHFHRLIVQPQENALRTEWPPLSFGSVRLWDSGTNWADIAPRPGEWRFERLDTYVHTAVAHRATLLYTLGSTPRWASARPDEPCPYGQGCAAEPVRIGHWEEYVRRVAQRYGNRIAAYELWNEPNFSDIPRDRGQPGFYTGSISMMVEMARVARKVLDEVSPAALLCTPGFVNGPDRLDRFLAAGGKNYVQAVCYHFYSENADRFARQILEVRAIMKRQGLENLPLWNTETGVEVYPPDQLLPPGTRRLSRTEAASRVAQFQILGAAAGLERYYYYAWDNERSGMISPAGVRQPAWDSYEKVQSWLLDATLYGCDALPPDGVQCQGERAGQRFLIVWAEKGGMHTIPVPAGQRIASVEKLSASSAESMGVRDRSPRLMLGSEPLRILFGSSQP